MLRFNFNLTFYNIAQQVIGISANGFEKTGPALHVFLFSSLLRKNPFYLDTATKYLFLSNVLTNIYLTLKQREEFLEYFCKVQRAYFALARFANLVRYKMAKCVVDFDMELNEITTETKGVVCIYQNNYTYLFKIVDLIHIMNNALTNSEMFFSNTLMVKNPFINIPFNKSTLYNIYFFIRFHTLIIPTVIHNYFLTNFNLNNFESKFEHLIREKDIHNFIFNSSDDILYPLTITMLKECFVTYHFKFNIHRDFPMGTLVKVMKPYLFLYYLQMYSLINSQKILAKRQLKNSLSTLAFSNPFFGRKHLHISNIYNPIRKKNVRKLIVTFNSTIPPRKQTSFLKSHENDNN